MKLGENFVPSLPSIMLFLFYDNVASDSPSVILMNNTHGFIITHSLLGICSYNELCEYVDTVLHSTRRILAYPLFV